jgi:DNA-binding SARP family transcriptional activator
VLDPDRRHEPDWTVTADRETIGLAIERVEIDVEVFLASAAAGLSLLRDGRLDEAQPRLEAAEAAYRGDFLGEDAYDDWAVGLREEARNLYIEVGHALARMAAARSDQAAAAMYLRRVLERDPYDEPAHLGLVAALVAAGRPGEARRAYGAYLDRMEELGAEAAAFPA